MSDQPFQPPTSSTNVPLASNGSREPHRSSPSLLFWLVAAMLLLGVLFWPALVQQYYYSATRGRELAQAEIAQEQLRSGHTASQADYRYIVKALQPSVVGVKA